MRKTRLGLAWAWWLSCSCKVAPSIGGAELDFSDRSIAGLECIYKAIHGQDGRIMIIMVMIFRIMAFGFLNFLVRLSYSRELM